MKGHARDLMSRHVTHVSPETTLAALASRMLEGPFGGLPVVDADSRVVGFVSETDLMGALLRRERPEVHARALMTSPALVLDEFATTADVMRLFREERIHHVPIVRAGKLVGVVSPQDVIRYFVAHDLTPEDEHA